MSFIYFIILIGVLIFVHELGHFVVAKFFDVKVLRFSIGFGPTLAKFQGEETEYTICVLPLGGYVQMQGASLELTEDLPDDEQERSLMAKPIWQRSLIVLAGPVANLILPAVIYFGFGLVQLTTPPAMVGQVHADSPAAEAGMQPGDRIVAIDDRDIDYWYQIAEGFDQGWDIAHEVTIERDGERKTLEVTPERHSSTDFLGLVQEERALAGIGLTTYGPTVALSERDGPAARDGLRFFDHVVAIDGQPIERYDDITTRVAESGGEPMEFVVLSRSKIPVDYGDLYHQDARTLTVTAEEVDGEYTLGIEPAQMYLTGVEDGKSADLAGLQPGDKIVSLDGRRYTNWNLFTDRLENQVNELIVERDEAGGDYDIEPSFELQFERDGELHTITYEPEVATYKDDTQQTHYRIEHGWETFSDTVVPDPVAHSFGDRLLYSSRQGVEQTWEFTKMMTVGLVRLAQGRIATESIGGPIMIGELAADAGDAGLEPFLRMLALISINLAIINLLPIPVLDGGRLVLYALEAAKRGPLSYRTRQIAAYIGIILVILLMVFAFKNDIERNWYRVVEFFGD